MVDRLTGGRLGGRPPQQFYPHCVECSNLQVRVGTNRQLRWKSGVCILSKCTDLSCVLFPTRYDRAVP